MNDVSRCAEVICFTVFPPGLTLFPLPYRRPLLLTPVSGAVPKGSFFLPADGGVAYLSDLRLLLSIRISPGTWEVTFSLTGKMDDSSLLY